MELRQVSRQECVFVRERILQLELMLDSLDEWLDEKEEEL